MQSARGNLERAAADNPYLLSVLEDIVDVVDATSSAAGVTPSKPPECVLNVDGVDGHFLVDILLPGQKPPVSNKRRVANMANADPLEGLRGATHELQSATDTKFDATSNVTTYGPSEKQYYDITDPNQTKYWRVRSSYDNGQTWSKWIYLTSDTVCGVVPVWSGLLRTLATDWLGSAATTESGASPLSQDGVTTNILVDDSTWKVGTQRVAFDNGEVDPGSFGTFYIYCIDLKKAGGQVEYLFTSDIAELTGQDGVVYFGSITTSGGGGGTGIGGGGGYSPEPGCLCAEVPVRMYDGTEKPAGEIQVGDQVEGVDGEMDVVERITLSVQPCFRVEMWDGKVIEGCSSTQPLMYFGGGFDKVFDLTVGNRLQTRPGDTSGESSTIMSKTFIGSRVVFKFKLSRSRTMWAAGVAAHNSMKEA